MLSITVTTGIDSFLTFNTFKKFDIPAPPNGADAEINGSLVLNFEDEEDALIYAEQLASMAKEINDQSTPQYMAIGNIIAAIWNDEFVQSYSRQY